jgi:hypothetical protein
MPIHEYETPSGVRVERIYLSGDKIPQAIEVEVLNPETDDYEVEIASLIISAPTIRFVGQFSGGTPQRHMKTQLPEGHEVLDEGGKRRMKELEKERKEKARAKTREFLADSLRTYDI